MSVPQPIPAEIPLVVAAMEIGVKYHRALNAVLEGELNGRRTEAGRWVVSRESVDRYLAHRPQVAA